MVQRAMNFTPRVLLSAPRRSAGIPNPAGTLIMYTLSTYSFETHTKVTDLRVLDVKSGESHMMAHNDEIGGVNWLDDDNFVCLQAEKDGTTSVYVASVKEVLRQVKFGVSHCIARKLPGPAENLKVKQIDAHNFAMVFTAEVNHETGDIPNPETEQKPHSSARIYNKQFVRHWDSWTTDRTQCLWYAKLSKEGNGKFTMSKYTNALHETGLESPIRPFGGTDNFDLSADGIIFVAKDPKLNPALNTKENVYLLNITNWEGNHARVLQQVEVLNFEGAASSPVFSPDGSKAAFLMMKNNGYEADKNQVFVLRDVRGPSHKPEQAFSASSDGSWNRSPGSIVWTADGKDLLATAEDIGVSKLYRINGDLRQETPEVLLKHTFVSDVKPLLDGRIFTSGSSLSDSSIYTIVDPRNTVSWTHSNSAEGTKLGGISSSQVSSIWTPASNPKINKEVHSFVIKPSNFDSSKKYPVAYLIHGGPQGAWGDSWSTRWNPMIFAEQGYIVITPNPTGSTGYGQDFTDAIRRNWGGDPYQDVVNVFEWAEKNIPEADHSRAVALGASYGGYMMNWIQGHPLGRKFRALVCHDGITSFNGAMLGTEELYFPLYDLGGTPWFDPGFKPAPGDKSAVENFGISSMSEWRKWDPSEHFDQWATPQLVIHSSKDYRLPIAEGLAAFNVLQARGVESKLLTFPDENHWVLKPENSLVWHKVVLNWINHYVGLPLYDDTAEESVDFLGGLKKHEKDGKSKTET